MGPCVGSTKSNNNKYQDFRYDVRNSRNQKRPSGTTQCATISEGSKIIKKEETKDNSKIKNSQIILNNSQIYINESDIRIQQQNTTNSGNQKVDKTNQKSSTRKSNIEREVEAQFKQILPHTNLKNKINPSENKIQSQTRANSQDLRSTFIPSLSQGNEQLQESTKRYVLGLTVISEVNSKLETSKASKKSRTSIILSSNFIESKEKFGPKLDNFYNLPNDHEQSCVVVV